MICARSPSCWVQNGVDGTSGKRGNVCDGKYFHGGRLLDGSGRSPRFLAGCRANGLSGAWRHAVYTGGMVARHARRVSLFFGVHVVLAVLNRSLLHFDTFVTA